nr:hypothetical protein [uncultured Arsenicibacter sp.]
MALVDDLNKVIEGIQKISDKGVPISLEHKFDTQTVSYFAGAMLLVGVIIVVMVGVKDVVVHNITHD